MGHFVKDDKMNIFRLPVGWQYLLNNKLGGSLDQTNAGKYDQLVQACLKTGATCVIDVSPMQSTTTYVFVMNKNQKKLTCFVRSTTVRLSQTLLSKKGEQPLMNEC